MSGKIQLFFFGTGGSIPYSNRKFPCIVLKYSSYMISFDFGEYCQFSILSSKIKPLSSDIFILITHLHEDHISGITTFLHTLSLANYNRRLIIIGPNSFQEMLFQWLSKRYWANIGFDVLFLTFEPELKFKKVFSNNLFRIYCFRTKHFTKSCGYLIEFYKRKFIKESLSEVPQEIRGILQNGFNVFKNEEIFKHTNFTIEKTFRIAYTGDTQPLSNLPFTDILIHEATYADEEFSIERGHSDVKRLLDIINKLGISKIFLVHISARYKDISEFLMKVNLPDNFIIPRDGDIFEFSF